MISAALATIIVDGKRAPDSWAYYCCERCGARFKKHGERFEPADAEEWKQYVDGAAGTQAVADLGGLIILALPARRGTIIADGSR